nr:6057_t:CDS:2 [Entrophospora candida]
MKAVVNRKLICEAISLLTRVIKALEEIAPFFEEAISNPSVGVIVAYHPPIFHAFKRLNLNDTKQNIVLKCIAEGISVYSPHTVDCSVGGGLGSGTSISLMPSEKPPAGHEGAGAGRLFTLKTNDDKDIKNDLEKKS